MQISTYWIIPVLSICLLNACSNGSAPDPSPSESASIMDAVTWKLDRLEEHPDALQDIEQFPELRFLFQEDGAMASGRGGVNSFGGKAIFNGQSLSIGPLAATRMAGPEHLMRVEDLFFNVLHLCNRWSLENDLLRLWEDDQLLAVFSRAPEN